MIVRVVYLVLISLLLVIYLQTINSLYHFYTILSLFLECLFSLYLQYVYYMF